MPDAITDLLADDGFRTGFLFGLVAAAAVALGALAARRTLPWAGVAFGVAAALALTERFTVDDDLVAGLVVLAAGGALTRGGHPLVRMAAALPGAVIVARSAGLDDPAWATPTIVVATVVGGALVSECDRSLGRWGLPPVLLAASALGVYVTTPDTEHAMLLVGVALALAPLGWPWPLGSLGAAGSFVVTAIVSWIVVVDGIARPGAVVGGIACLGVLVLGPPLSALRLGVLARGPVGSGTPRRRHAPAHAGAGPPPGPPLRDLAIVAVVHLGLVAACSRVAGLRTSAMQALAISAVAYALAAAALLAAGAVDTRRPAPAE